MHFFVTSTNVLIPIMNASQMDKLVMLFFNLASIALAAFTGVSIFIANNLSTTLSELFGSTQFIIGTTLSVGFLSLYLFYDLSENIFGKILTKFKKLEEEIGLCNKEIDALNSIIYEIECLDLDTKPIKDLTETEMIIRDEKMSKLDLILEKIKRMRKVSKITIDIELTKKMN